MFTNNNKTKQNARGYYSNQIHPGGYRREDFSQPLLQQQPGPSWGYQQDYYAAYDYPINPRSRQPMGPYAGNYNRSRERQNLYPETGMNYSSRHRPREYPDKLPPRKERASERETKVNKEHKVTHKNISSSSTKAVDPKVYTCPGCCHPYYFSGGRISGKVPLILNCKHTVCQECIIKSANRNNILCPVCQKPSVLQDKNSIDNLSEVFLPNYHIIGVISFSKCMTNNNLSLTLVPADDLPSKKNTSASLHTGAALECGDECCFASCVKPASLRCDDCNDVYCKDCSVVIHKSAKSLWTHKPQPITKNTHSRELEICQDHNMDEEYLCKECQIGACCYCLIEKHTGHKKDDISKLSDEDLCQVLDNTGKLKRVLKQLCVSQKRLKDLCNPETTAAEKKIWDYFANLHGMLECAEKSVRKKASDLQNSLVIPEDQKKLTASINRSIADLQSLIYDCEQVGDKKLNIKKLKEDVSNALQTPCYLLTDSKEALEPVSFHVDPIVEKLEDCFNINFMEISGLRLVTAEELPPDYEIKPLNFHSESDLETSMTSLDLSDSNKKKSVTKKHNIPRMKKSGNLDNELIEVTHIESLDCFYVQIKKMQGQLRQLQNDISNFIKMADAVDQPYINELYLVLYTNRQEKMWCRGRLIEIKNGETEPLYEIFFIDYGNSQTVDISKLKEITAPLAQVKPFAIQCQLHNPGFCIWKKNAHVCMGKMINGKDIYITVKDRSNAINIVDLLVSSSDRSLTSLVDILVYTCGDGKNGDTSSESSQTQGYTSEHKIFSNSKTFQKNQVEKVVIAKIVDPDNIYILLADNLEAIQKLSNALKIHFKNARSNTCILIEGSYVVVEHKDPIRGNWHRALIKKVDINHETANVFLVDWGFHVTVPWNRVKMLKEQFTSMEAQAIRVKLAHVEPIDKTGSWSDHATHFLQQYFLTQETLNMRIHQTDPLEIALFQINGSTDVCINTLLVKEKLAHSSGAISKKLEWVTDSVEVEPFSHEEGLVESLLAKVENTDSSDSADEDTSTVRQQIRIVKVVNPGLIYIRFVVKDDLATALHKELQIHYSKEREMQEAWKPGDDCVVVYGNIYTRGKVLGVEDNGYKVNLYDQAEEVTLPTSEMFVYNKYFYKYANIVYKAYLANIKPAGGDTWSMSSIEALEKIFEKYDKIYATKVPGDTSEKSIPMKIWYTQTKVGSALEANQLKFYCIINKLVKMGFAYKISPKLDIEPTTSNGAIKPSEKLLLSMAAKTDSDPETSNNDEPTDWNALVEEEEKREQLVQQPTKEGTITEWLPPIQPAENEFDAWITCAETEGILFYRQDVMQPVYKEMEKNIKEYFSNKKHVNKKKHIWKPGDLCMIVEKDLYYRGKVHQVADQDHIKAVMIDFGSDHDVTSADLINEIIYTDIPAFVCKLKMDKVYAKCGNWLESDYQTLLEIVTEYSKIVIKGNWDTQLPLAEVYNNSGESVNDLLVLRCNNLVRSLRKDVRRDESDDDVVIEEEVIIESEELIDTEYGDVNRDENGGNTDKYGEIESSEQKEEVMVSVRDCDTSIKSTSTYKMQALPKAASTVPMKVVSVLDYKHVVLQLADETSEPDTALQTDIDNSLEEQQVLDNFTEGLPCIAHCAVANSWQRALIHSTKGIECGYVFVFFVDNGIVDSLPLNEVKTIKSEWLEKPVVCHLAQLQIELESLTHKDHVFQFIRKMQGRIKQVKIITEKPLTVQLLEESGDLSYKSLILSGMLYASIYT